MKKYIIVSIIVSFTCIILYFMSNIMVSESSDMPAMTAYQWNNEPRHCEFFTVENGVEVATGNTITLHPGSNGPWRAVCNDNDNGRPIPIVYKESSFVNKVK